MYRILYLLNINFESIKKKESQRYFYIFLSICICIVHVNLYKIGGGEISHPVKVFKIYLVTVYCQKKKESLNSQRQNWFNGIFLISIYLLYTLHCLGKMAIDM